MHYALSLIKETGPDFALFSVPEFGSRYPIVVKEQFSFGGQADDIVLTKGIEFQEHLVVIIVLVYGEGGFVEKGGCSLHGTEGDVINGGKVFSPGRMDSGENAHGMAAFIKETGFRGMISFFINVFGVRTFGAVPDETETFKALTVGFDDIRVIDEDNRLRRDYCADVRKIRFNGRWRNTFIQMSGEPFHDIDFLCLFMEPVYDIGEEAAVGGKDAIGHVGSELFIQLGEFFRDFIGKR